jgi:hypothetical protein
MKTIYEYELKFTIKGKVIKAQQSAYTFKDAQHRILKRYPSATKFSLVKRLSYPHGDGGVKINA